MRKIILGLSIILLANIARAQNGLESVIVEKYYISNAADSVGSIGVLPAGSITYRFYVDMLPGYKFQAAYGVPGHALTFTTTTAFFNNEDRGATTPTYSKTQARANTVMLDSWLSVGSACTGNFGILKSEDDVATGGATVINNTVPAILQNNDALAGIPLTTQDGLFTGTPEAVTFVGISASDLAALNAVSNQGNLFTTSNGSWASLNGSTGPAPSGNKVLIAQITTNGVLHYELNVQIGTPTGGVQNFVALNPTGAEITIPSMIGTLGGASNQSPTVNITLPVNNASFITGANVTINATAGDADGTVASVEFFVDNVSVGIDNSSPYSASYIAVSGPHVITAKATDNLGAQTTSSDININVNSNPPPTVNITAPANGATFVTGANVSITATATDNVSVASVEFFVDGVSIGVDNSSPYSDSYIITAGSHVLTAVATDNQGAQTTSSDVNISAGNNIPPVTNITAPIAGTLYVAPATVNITADATDADGNVTLVEFYVNNVLVGSDATDPYTFNWTSLPGSASLTVRATDNLGAHTISSAVLISIADPNIPYKILTTKSVCIPTTFCIPLVAIEAVQNVIGYDIVFNYQKTKVSPTGNITVNNALINPSYVDVINSVDTANGKMNISLFFNATAPANTKFDGTGNLICIEFSKTAGFSPIDSAAFSISSLQESYFPGTGLRNVDPGKYYTYKDTVFHGNLKFWNNNTPLGYDDANPNQYRITNVFGNNTACTNKSIVAVQPNPAGLFTYSTSNGRDVQIERDILGNTSIQPVVNGFDALQARKILLNDMSFVPSIYQAIAADVNMDGVISAGDVSQMNQRIVLMIPEFKQAWNYDTFGVSNGQLSKDWIFIDSTTITGNNAYRISVTYPSDDGTGFSKSRIPVVPFCLPVPIANFATCPQISLATFRGVMLGDINGSFATVGSGGLFKINNAERIIFDLPESVMTDGYIEVPVSISSDQSINALDLALSFDETVLRFESIVDRANNIQLLANFNTDDRTLRITSNSIQNYDLSKSILSLRFEVMKNKVIETDMNILEGYLNGERVNAEFRNLNNTNTSGNYWLKVYPNPAREVLNVESSDNAMIQLFDVEGRNAMQLKNINALQKQEINTRDLANGIYLLKVTGEKFSTFRRVIVNN